MTTDELQQKLEAAEAHLRKLIQQEEQAHDRRVRQEGAVLTLRMLLQEGEHPQAELEESVNA